MREALLRKRRDLRLQRRRRLRGHLRIFDDQRQVLRDVVQIGDDGIDRPAGAVALQHRMKRFELGLDRGSRRAVLRLEQRRRARARPPARGGGARRRFGRSLVSVVSSRIDSRIWRNGDVGADSARSASYFGLSASSFFRRRLPSAERQVTTKSLE